MKSVIMGSKKTDPYCSHLTNLTPSNINKGYPPFLRINPIIDWSYEQVWNFILDFNVPYCKLYDEGFSSLGNIDNTCLNPHL